MGRREMQIGELNIATLSPTLNCSLTPPHTHPPGSELVPFKLSPGLETRSTPLNSELRLSSWTEITSDSGESLVIPSPHDGDDYSSIFPYFRIALV